MFTQFNTFLKNLKAWHKKIAKNDYEVIDDLGERWTISLFSGLSLLKKWFFRICYVIVALYFVIFLIKGNEYNSFSEKEEQSTFWDKFISSKTERFYHNIVIDTYRMQSPEEDYMFNFILSKKKENLNDTSSYLTNCDSDNMMSGFVLATIFMYFEYYPITELLALYASDRFRDGNFSKKKKTLLKIQLLLGQTYYQLNDYENSMFYLKDCIAEEYEFKIDYDRFQAFMYHGMTLNKQKQYDKAVISLNKALSIQKQIQSKRNSWRWLNWLFFNTTDFGKSVNQLEDYTYPQPLDS